MGRKRKKDARHVCKVTLLQRIHAGRVTRPYEIMEELIEKHHTHLRDAKIAIAWHFGWKPDADGRLRLARCKKGSDLDRELHPFDLVILLNHDMWNRCDFTENQQRAVIDHELCHMQVRCDTSGVPLHDTRDRIVYRMRGHDVEEFQEVVGRHGVYTSALEQLAMLTFKGKDLPLFAET